MGQSSNSICLVWSGAPERPQNVSHRPICCMGYRGAVSLILLPKSAPCCCCCYIPVAVNESWRKCTRSPSINSDDEQQYTSWSNGKECCTQAAIQRRGSSNHPGEQKHLIPAATTYYPELLCGLYTFCAHTSSITHCPAVPSTEPASWHCHAELSINSVTLIPPVELPYL